MPYLETVVMGLNRVLNDPEVRRYCKENRVFTAGIQLAQLAGTLGASPEPMTRGWKEYLQSIPSGLQEALRSVIAFAIDRDLALAFSWEPAYDFEVAIWHTPDGNETKGGVKIRLRSRYPQDKLPPLR